jgi:hypothetical protein
VTSGCKPFSSREPGLIACRLAVAAASIRRERDIGDCWRAGSCRDLRLDRCSTLPKIIERIEIQTGSGTQYPRQGRTFCHRLKVRLQNPQSVGPLVVVRFYEILFMSSRMELDVDSGTIVLRCPRAIPQFLPGALPRDHCELRCFHTTQLRNTSC